MQRSWTPSRPARSINSRCLATFASRIVSSFSEVEQAWVAWINPHFTILGMSDFPLMFHTRPQENNSPRKHGGPGEQHGESKKFVGVLFNHPAVFRALRASVVKQLGGREGTSRCRA